MRDDWLGHCLHLLCITQNYVRACWIASQLGTCVLLIGAHWSTEPSLLSVSCPLVSCSGRHNVAVIMSECVLVPVGYSDPHGGYSEGVNEFGVSIGNEMFPSHHLPTDDGRKAQAEFTDLDRLVLERSKTAKEAVLNFADLVGKYGQTCKRCPEAANYNSLFMISDPHEIYSLVSGYRPLVSSDFVDTFVAPSEVLCQVNPFWPH
eukprot:COSAG02_NODE_340_length_24179_cov_6.401644_17_plen_205_part_00